jgi:hypothetical protein
VGISSLTGAEADADAGTAVRAGSSARAGASAEAAAGTSGTAPAGLPQTSQYPSTIVPVHPACVQAEMRPLRDLAETPAPRPSTARLASTADPGDAAEAAAGTNGTAPAGLPQTSQYPSTIVPVHPGSVQVCMRSLPGLAETPAPRPSTVGLASTADPGDAAEAAAGTNGTASTGLPQTSQYPSTIVPVHPGSVQVCMRSLPGLAETPDPRPTGICPASTADAGDTAEAAAPSGANGTAPAGLPQTSQYPSTILPVHPGCVQALIRPPFLVRAIEFAIIRLCRSRT